MGKNNNNRNNNNRGGDKGSWYDFKIGKSFSANDIKRAENAGFSQNQILKIAASAPFVKNSANKTLSSFNNIYTTPRTGSMYQPSSGRIVETRGVGQSLLFPNQDAKKALSWNGVNADGRANALTINKPNGSGWGMMGPNQKSGEPFGQWATPLKIQDKLKPSTGPVSTGTPDMPAPAGGGGGGDSGSVDGAPGGPMGPMAPLKKESTSIAGFDSSINDSVTSFRRKKSKARSLGLTSKGTSQFKIGGQSSTSAGLNLGM